MTGLGLLAPWLLGAIAAAAIPVIAHLARAEPREGRAFPSLMFLKRVPVPSKARRRVRDRVLLALRLLALLALVLAFAGPYPLYDGATAPPPGRDTVVLLDVSYSMASPGLFEAARERASEAVAEAAAAGRVAVLAFDTATRTLSGLGEGEAAARQALSGLTPGDGATDLARALEGAERLLAASPAAVRRVVLVTDMQEAAARREPRLREDIELDIRAVAAPRPGNLALLAAWTEEAGPVRDGPTVLRARVANTGGERAAGTLRIAVDGLAGDAYPLILAPGEAREIPLPLFPAADRPTRVQLSLDGEGSGLGADDHLYRVLARRRPVEVLLVQAPGASPHLGAALALGRDPALRVSLRSPAAVTVDEVVAAEVVVLDGAAPAAAPVREQLAARVSAGGGLLWLAGDGAGDAALAEPLLPVPASLVLPGPRGTAFGELAPGHPLAAVAGGAAPGGAGAALSAVTAWRYRRVIPAAGDEVLTRFDSGDPALLARAYGAGRSLLLATSTSPEWSTLALEPVFVPLVLEALAWLAGRPALPGAVAPGSAVDVAALAAAAAGGEALARALSAGEVLRVRAPDGGERRLDADAPVVLVESGFHQLRAGDAPALPVAVSVDARESLLAPLGEARFRERLRRGPAPAGGRRPAFAAGEPDRGLARALLALAAGLLLLESVLAGRIMRRRAGAAAGAREASA